MISYIEVPAADGTMSIFLLILLSVVALVALALVVALVVYLVVRHRRKATAAAPKPPAPGHIPAPGEGARPPCPRCGSPVPADAPMGVCPKCVLQVGMAGQGATQGPSFASGGTAAGQSGGPTGPGFTPPAVADLAPYFPNLEILELLGQGGMGAVYKARQKGLDRLVALKVLPPGIGYDVAFAERFKREARSLARLNHPSIVAVYDFGEAAGLYYFVMEFVDGVNLRQMERAERLVPHEALGIVVQVCEALQFAHDEGIVHRDIKPENILIDKKGRVKIADFGLAKLLAKTPADFTITGPEQAMGTPVYMAPEQLERPAEVDQRADIYSLGVVFYEMLTGELPLGRFPPPSQKVQIDVRLDEVVLKTLEKEPDRRYQHASEVKTEVQQITGGPPAAAAASTPPGSPGPVIGLAGGAQAAAARPGAGVPPQAPVAPPAASPGRASRLAVAGLLCAVAAVVLAPVGGLVAWALGVRILLVLIPMSVVLVVTGLVLGIVAAIAIKRSKGRLSGGGMAAAAIVVASVAVLLGAALSVVAVPALFLAWYRDEMAPQVMGRDGQGIMAWHDFSSPVGASQAFKEALQRRDYRRLAEISGAPPSPLTEEKWHEMLTSSERQLGSGRVPLKDLPEMMTQVHGYSSSSSNDKAEVQAGGVTFCLERHADGKWYFTEFK